MKMVFASNYYNHHQSALCAELACRTEDFRFVATGEMRQERRALGYGMDAPDFVLYAHRDDRTKAQQVISRADAVIAGSAPEELIAQRIRQGKLVYRYCERLLKKNPGLIGWVKRFISLRRRNPKGKPVYLLCAGGYVAADFEKFGLFKGRAYKWGYFPETVKYPSVPSLMAKKRKNEILWAGRLIDWKHPEQAIAVAKGLKAAGCEFTLNIIGSGELEDTLQQKIQTEGLTDCVKLLGSMKPDAVRTYMERASIFLATSDRQEGWGAVVNEAMNSGCAVVASHAIGSVPYLIENEKNGLVYRSGDIEMLLRQVQSLLADSEKSAAMGACAYETIVSQWNAEVAAQRLCRLTEAILSGDGQPQLYESGPCSRAPILSDDWV